MKTASGASNATRASGAFPAMTVIRCANPKAAAFLRMFPARSSRASTAMAFPPHSAHSTEIEPEPAPMSHSRSPGRGASAESASARTGRLVIWPSWTKSSSDSPELRGRPCTPLASKATVTRLPSSSPAKLSARCASILSRGPPSAASVQNAEAPHPRAVSHFARSPAAFASRTRQMMRAPRARCGTRRSNGAAWRPRQAIASRRQPSRAAANENVDGAECAIHSPAPSLSARLAPAPYQNGSPEASTAVGRPRQLNTTSASNGTGHGWPRPVMPASARCRSPPKTVSALASAFRLASDSPARPSSPMPMMVSQGSAMTRALILGGTADASLLAAEIVRAGLEAVYSYGGRTRAPADQPLPTRIGGFGGANGLANYIRSEGITRVIDATHPFAAEMSRNAVEACAQTDTPLIALERAPWTKAAGDNWIEVAGVNAAVAALPESPAKIFLAIGRQHIAPFAIKPQ